MPPKSPRLSFELIDSEEGLKAVAVEWRELSLRMTPTSPFSDIQWVTMVFRRVVAANLSRPLVAVVRQDGALVLGIALQCVPYRWFFRRFVGTDAYFRQTESIVIALEGDAAAWLATLCRGLRFSWRYTALVLSRLPALGRLNALATRASIRSSVAVGVTDLSRGYEHYLASFARQTRSELRRMRKLLAAHGPITERAATVETFAEDLHWLLEQKRRWSPPGNGPLAQWVALPECEADLNELAQSWLRDRRLALLQIELSGRRVAAGLVLCAGETAVFYATTYDPDFAQFSPGRMLAFRLMEWAAANGITRFDFMGGRWQWKQRLETNQYRQLRIKLPL